ncbi:RHS repeat-associated core domain-containing protein [Candidatus Enterococcus lemimoniae]|uniref:Uncharacterized protein n=1 Tax=Candidatus Enterococcus lemimoniae TaxID=1834167 RepID=A0ABZ2T0N3_9ENTE
MTNRQSGELITNTLYNEYGEAALRLENEYGYRSEYHDQSNRIHLRAREYSTTTGRFLQEDTWYGKMEQPQSQNRYIYVENNPQKYRDRSGNASWWSKAWNNVKKTVRNVWNGVKRVVNTVWNAIVPPAYRSPSSWSGVASGINYIGNYVARSYTPRRNYVGVNYIRGRNGQPVGYQTYNQALYYQSAAYRYQVQVQRAKATRAMATVRIKKACDTADKKWVGKNKGLVVGAAFVIPIPRVPVIPPVTMIPKPGLDIDSGNFSFPSLPKIPSARDIANGIVGWFIGDYIQKIEKDESDFKTEKQLKEHYKKHVEKQGEFGDISQDEYLEGARDLIKSKGNKKVHSKVRKKNGDTLIYDETTNELVIVDKNGNIKTYFKPERGLDYYNEQ